MRVQTCSGAFGANAHRLQTDIGNNVDTGSTPAFCKTNNLLEILAGPGVVAHHFSVSGLATR